MKCLILITTIVGFLNVQILSQQIIKLEILFQKGIFLVGEPIEFVLSAENVSDKKVEEYFGGYNINLTNQNNELIPLTRYARNGGSMYLNLRPKDVNYWRFDALWIFGKGFKNSWVHLFLPVGNYNLQINISDPRCEPNELNFQFQVLEPEGDESFVYYTLMDLLTREHTSSEEITMIESFYQNYPSSVYFPMMLDVLISEYSVNLKDDQKAYEIIKLVLEHYPASSLAYLYLVGTVDKMENDLKKIEVIKNIKSKVQGTLYEKMYQQKIEEIEKNIK